MATVDRALPTRAATSSWLNPKSIDELSIGVGSLDRVEIRALEVLDEGELERVSIDHLADDGRDPVESGGLRGAKPSLTGDELVSACRLGHQDRLEYAVGGDAGPQRGEILWVEALARLVGVRTDPRDRDLDRTGVAAATLGDQCTKPATKTTRALSTLRAILTAGLLRVVGHDAIAASRMFDRAPGRCPSRWRSSVASPAYAAAPVDSGE